MSEYHEVLYLSNDGQWFLIDQRTGDAESITEVEGWQRAKAMERWLLDRREKEE